MSGPRSRKEVFWPPTVMAYYHDTLGISPDSEVVTEGYAFQDLIISEGHPWPPSKGDIADRGGSFAVMRREYSDSGTHNEYECWRSGQYWKGRQFAVTQQVSDADFPVVVPTPKAELSALATMAIANILPTNPLSNLSTFLGELREGLPSLPGIRSFRDRSSIARNAGSEYLNHQFGWLPLISDLKKFSNAVKNSDALLKAYEKNSGKLLRRTVRIVSDSQTEKEDLPGWYPVPYPPGAMPFNLYDGFGDLTGITTTRRNVWFSGAFTYYLPPFKENDLNVKRNLQLHNYLYGSRVTPEVLWDLAPWTWAADWFGNFGSILHNVSAFQNDGLVMPYGYIMETKSSEVTYRKLQKYVTYADATLTQTFKTTSKVRFRGSPYGFGLTLGDLTSRQMAIIGALGLTRGSKLKHD